MAWNIEDKRMKIFTKDKITEAQNYTPQIERFIDDKIYIIETLGDYDTLPENIKLWRLLMAQSG